MPWNEKLWKDSIDQFAEFLEPLVCRLGRTERRVGAALYVQGLLLPGERKSIEPMAQRLGTDSQKLQQFIADSPWAEEQVWQAIRREVVPVMEPLSAWIIDETGWLKQGDQPTAPQLSDRPHQNPHVGERSAHHHCLLEQSLRCDRCQRGRV